MSKLFTLKVWLSLDGAAKRLSESFSESVTEADVIQLALDGHLRLSLRLLASHLYARRWYKKQKDEIEYEEVEYRSHEGANTGQPAFKRLEPVEGEVIHLPEFCGEDERLQLGMWPIAYARDQPGREIVDLPITRYSRVFLLQCLDALSRPPEDAQYDTGRLLIQEESGDIWQIESYDDCLLEDIEVVIRTQALRNLEQSLAQTLVAGQEKALSTRERDTLYKIIIGMAVEGYRYKPDAARNEATADIARDLEKQGIAVDADTVRKHLKSASQLLPSKPP